MSILTQAAAEQVLTAALSTGGDFAEIFAEDTLSNSFSMIDNKLETVLSGRSYGVGVRVLKGVQQVFASTNDLSLEGLLQVAKRVAAAIGSGSGKLDLCLTQQICRNLSPILQIPSSVSAQRKIPIVKDAYQAAKEYSSEVSQVSVSLVDKDRRFQIANSEGLFLEDRRCSTRLGISAVASSAGENQTGFEGPGRQMGYEMFGQTIDPAFYAVKAAKRAVTMLHAGNCPSGKMMVAIDNGFGGVIFHEACGHSLEATSVSKGHSEFCGKLGQQIASPKVTAYDDGTIPNAWGTINVDDEGTPSRCNLLIEKGVLKGYMIDKLGGRRMGMEPTGSSRRQDYHYAPTSRMTNTYIAAGNDRYEDIIGSMEYGLYAASMGGGSVNPVTGEFNFAVAEGYLVRHGEICEPVRGASLIGKGSEILMNIDMVSDNLDMAQGMCGSQSGSVPTNVGQPLIRVSEITVGGRE